MNSRYNEIMEKVVLSGDAKERILINVQSALSADIGPVPLPKKQTGFFFRVSLIAACLVVLAVSAVGLSWFLSGMSGASSAITESSATAAEIAAEKSEDVSEEYYPTLGEGEYDGAAAEEAEETTADVPADYYASVRELSEAAGFPVNDISVLSDDILSASYILSDGTAEICYELSNGTALIYTKACSDEDESSGLSVPNADYDAACTWSQNGYTCGLYYSEELDARTLSEIIDELRGEE